MTQIIGPTQAKWFGEGYQAALADLATQFDQGGEKAAREWIKNNSRAENTSKVATPA